MTLRAVGNLGYSDALSSTLESCTKNTAVPINVRVTAVQAYRGLSCGIDVSCLFSEYVHYVTI